MSILYDSRSRIRMRIAQLNTRRRHTQTPRSELARLTSNIEITDVEANEVSVRANALVYADNLRGETPWASHNEYRLRLGNGVFRRVLKKTALVNNNQPL